MAMRNRAAGVYLDVLGKRRWKRELEEGKEWGT